MTVALLMSNTLRAAERIWEQARSLRIKPLKLDIKEKVPSDIEIAMAQIPKPVTQLAHEIGLLPDEVESYGKYKAKVELSVLDRLAHKKDGKYIVISGYVVSCTGFLSDGRRQLTRWTIIVSHPPLSVKESRQLQLVLRKLSVLTLDDPRLHVCVSPARDPRLVSREVPPVEDTARSFLWMRSVISAMYTDIPHLLRSVVQLALDW